MVIVPADPIVNPPNDREDALGISVRDMDPDKDIGPGVYDASDISIDADTDMDFFPSLLCAIVAMPLLMVIDECVPSVNCGALLLAWLDTTVPPRLILHPIRHCAKFHPPDFRSRE